MNTREVYSLTSPFPKYSNARHFLRILDSVPYSLYFLTSNTFRKQGGTVQAPVDWSDPDSWIPERLDGEEQALAWRVWRESKKELNPRYMGRSWDLAKKHKLIIPDSNNILRVSERGHDFLNEPEGPVVADIDRYEGVLIVLRLVADHGPGKRSCFFPSYNTFCRTYTTICSEGRMKRSLTSRLTNLRDRAYVALLGQTYEITDTGLAYIEAQAQVLPGQLPVGKPAKQLSRGEPQQSH